MASWGAVERALRENPGELPGIRPRYDGLGLANLPRTLLDLLGVPGPPTPGLRPGLVPGDLAEGVEKVVLLVLDGLGHGQLLREVAAGNAPHLARLMEEGAYAPLATVLPSTTATALTTLCTGLTPQGHGIMGYRLYLREFGVVANMIRLGPATGGDFTQTGLDPRGLLPEPTLFEACRAAGVRPYVLTRWGLAATPFSAMLHRGADVVGHGGTADLFVHLRRLLRREGPAFVYAYWEGIDSAGHAYGGASEEHAAELAAIDFSLGRELLAAPGDRRALLVVTADHGHLDVPAERTEFLDAHPDLLRLLRTEPTGDARLPYLHVLPGQREAAAAYVEEALGTKALILPSARAFELGLFGLGTPRPEAVDRVGDLLLVPRGDWAFPFRRGPGEPLLIGRHGGPSEAEMLVPLLVHRL